MSHYDNKPETVELEAMLFVCVSYVWYHQFCFMPINFGMLDHAIIVHLAHDKYLQRMVNKAGLR